jgi:hypothetical protein
MLTRNLWISPYPLLIGLTLLTLVPVVPLVAIIAAPIPDECAEYCGLAPGLATFGLVLIGLFWLFLALGLAWTWDERSRTIAPVSAIAASLGLAIVSLYLFKLITPGSSTLFYAQFAWVMSLGLQLPPVWRLAKRQPSTRLRFVVDAMGVVVGLAALATFFLGTDPLRGPGPNIVFLAWILFVLGLFVVVVRAWRDGTASLSMVAPLLASCVPLLAIPLAVVFPGDLVYMAFLALPLSAIGWSWIAIAWFRGQGAWLTTP